MVESSNKSPCSGPGEGLQVEVAYVIKDVIVVTRNSSNYKQLVIMKDSCVSCSTFGNRPRDCWLCPMRCFEIEDYEIGEVGSMFIFAAEDE
jgi:hypothetical protein